MPITTPETELAFRQYANALEMKDAAKAALKSFKHVNCDYVVDPLLTAMNDVLSSLDKLLKAVQDEVVRLRPEKTIEQRGYSAIDRGVAGFGGCGDNCGGCGSGGGCGGGSCGGSGGCNP